MFFKKSKKHFSRQEVFPDEIFLDSKNLPQFDRHQFEGLIEKSISKRAVYIVASFFAFVTIIFIFKAWSLQIMNGTVYAEKSENNRLDHEIVFAERGIINDREGVPLVWNTPRDNELFATRSYVATSGFAHLLGHVSYPKKDKKGFYYDDRLVGKGGVEEYFNDFLEGDNGLNISETDALGNIISKSTIRPPVHGDAITLSIHAGIQAKLYEEMRGLSERVGFRGGAGAIMDVQTGEVLAFVSFPEFDPSVMSEGKNNELISQYLGDKRNVFLNRLSNGLYTPGSIVKPFVALGALEESIVNPNKVFHTTGKIEIVNPYNREQSTYFNDWKNHGDVDMRRAIAVSSNVYFYTIGGGFGEQRGLGITKLSQYFRKFGFDTPLTGFFEGKAGVVPDPEWKKSNFDGDDWRLGDTYFTAIGQYGFQTTPMQALRAIAAIANGGRLIEPTIEKNSFGAIAVGKTIDVDIGNIRVVKEGMRQGVLEGTAKALNVPYVEVAAKTGTAELGVSKAKVNSWNMGFWPYENPRYAFVVMMEQGDRTNTIGSAYIMRQVIDWIQLYAPEYLK